MNYLQYIQIPKELSTIKMSLYRANYSLCAGWSRVQTLEGGGYKGFSLLQNLSRPALRFTQPPQMGTGALLRGQVSGVRH